MDVPLFFPSASARLVVASRDSGGRWIAFVQPVYLGRQCAESALSDMSYNRSPSGRLKTTSEPRSRGPQGREEVARTESSINRSFDPLLRSSPLAQPSRLHLSSLIPNATRFPVDACRTATDSQIPPRDLHAIAPSITSASAPRSLCPFSLHPGTPSGHTMP